MSGIAAVIPNEDGRSTACPARKGTRDGARPPWLGRSVRDRHERKESGAFQWETVMKAIFGKLFKDERGGEVLEYALIMGLIVVASIAVIGTVGGKVLARWQSVNSSM